MPQYALTKPRYLERPSVYGEGRAVTEWVREPGFGLFPTNVSAKRAYVEAMLPELAGQNASDDLIRRHFRSFSVNLGQVKVIKVA